MKNNLLLISVICSVAGLTACETTKQNQEELKPRIGMPNPASAYCVEQGGTLSIKKDADGGERGICTLANGQQVDEWDFFRKANGK
ncbi:putative hemolysin [Acinetobacter shaoyimingii]|uniref:DUF333 domain-containing protein n=1 Tax=Acinetobacter shaoyimingii TaxID=2715164 RepID=A0A6G8RSU5_9GAMM|nr:DUF333 domain-containing protein [Acinetobacter shaoyimingii]QIO05002.1 DUF333 domain-containing protein [Acinetobacter shaoyimingii]